MDGIMNRYRTEERKDSQYSHNWQSQIPFRREVNPSKNGAGEIESNYGKCSNISGVLKHGVKVDNHGI